MKIIKDWDSPTTPEVAAHRETHESGSSKSSGYLEECREAEMMAYGTAVVVESAALGPGATASSRRPWAGRASCRASVARGRGMYRRTGSPPVPAR